MFYVKKMTKNDSAFAVEITDTMEWMLGTKDFEFMLKLEPDGCFVLCLDSQKIGVVTTVSYGKIGWLGNLIVSEKHRQKGGGSFLVKHAIKTLINKNVKTVGLYAYFGKIPFYRKLGFRYISDFIVLKGKGFASRNLRLKEATKNNALDIITLDDICFGDSRKKILDPLLLNQQNVCYTLYEDEQLSGYVLAKVFGATAELGPLVCQKGRTDIALPLLQAALNRLEGLDVSICIPEKEFLIHKTLISSGFQETFRVAKMFLGPPIITDCIYAAESLERG